MLGLMERPGIGDGTAASPGVPGLGSRSCSGRQGGCLEGVCSGQALCPAEDKGWPGMLGSLQGPRLLCSCPSPVLFMAQAAAFLGCFQRAEKDALGSEGLAAQGQGIAESIGGWEQEWQGLSKSP